VSALTTDHKSRSPVEVNRARAILADDYRKARCDAGLATEPAVSEILQPRYRFDRASDAAADQVPARVNCD
jgi:hypothetical protein